MWTSINGVKAGPGSPKRGCDEMTASARITRRGDTFRGTPLHGGAVEEMSHRQGRDMYMSLHSVD